MNRLCIGAMATALAVVFLAAGACSPSSGDGDADADADVDGGTSCAELGILDSDGDGISDLEEGRYENPPRDTDRDGIPDYLDLDSDGDGIPDAIEAGRASCADPPRDTDGDGIPDYLDLDSDGNGIPDSIEGTDDLDGDGNGNWRDFDDDGDGIPDIIEIGPDPAYPTDTDGDGVPDYHDLDSDGDCIADFFEGHGDVDRDGLRNYQDLDSDGDGIPDREESGNVTCDLSVPPRDCDGDGIPDFLDRDSDNDGLPDAIEREIGTDPCNPDTDEDGLTDLVEWAIGTDPLDATSGIGEDEYMVVLPFMDDPQERELVFTTNIKQADVYFLIDTTGSMWGVLGTIRTFLSTYIVPEVASMVRDVEFGLGRFDDVPIAPYGDSSDVAYQHHHDISRDIASVQSVIDTFPTGGGYDGPESYVIALYCTATGDGVDWASVPRSPGCLEGRFGYPCFRPYSLPIILLFGDNYFHNGPPDGLTEPYVGYPNPNWLDAVAVLNDIGAKVLGFFSGGSWGAGAREHYVMTAEATGAVRRDGTPLVWDLDSSGVGLDAAVVEAIADLSTQVARDVNTTVEESPRVDDGIDAADFVRSVVPVRANPARGVARMDDTTFYSVEAGTLLTFNVTFQNDFVPHTDEPQVFVARIVVLGDNTVRLDDRRVIILIPPRDITID